MPEAKDLPEYRPESRAGRTNVAAVEGCYQLVLWLIPVLDNLPRRQKFQLGDRLQTTALLVLETLIEAAYTRDRSALLQKANLELEKLRFWIRLAHELQLLDFKRYEHAARLIDDLGRQVGGWLRAQQGRSHPSRQRADAQTPPRAGLFYSESARERLLSHFSRISTVLPTALAALIKVSSWIDKLPGSSTRSSCERLVTNR